MHVPVQCAIMVFVLPVNSELSSQNTVALIFTTGGWACLQDDFKEGVAACLSPEGGRIVISERFATASLPSDSACVVAVEKSSLSAFGEFYRT